jgi:hypothetical protein
MADVDLLAIGVVLSVAFLSATLVSFLRIPGWAKLLMYIALPLRFVGAYARQAIAMDAHVYYRWGTRYAEYFSRLDFAPLFDPLLWRGSQWTGTNFIGYPTGLVISLIGPSWLGTFFAFGLLSFAGLVAFALAYRRGFPGTPYTAYWAWIFLLPSLWFWPSSIGKECVMLIGLGVATLGFAGRGRRPNWLLMAAGLAVVFCVRPQVVAVYLFAIILSYWLDFRQWTPGKMVQGLAILAGGLVGIWFAMATTLGGEVDLDTVGSYVDSNATRNEYGGSSIAGVGFSPASAPLAVINVLFRPFIWEVHNVSSVISAFEVILIWGLVWFRRREFAAALRMWRQHRMLRFAIPFAILYVTALGMNLSNLGLLARQRVLAFPFLFLVVEAGAHFSRRRAHVQVPRHAPQGTVESVAV